MTTRRSVLLIAGGVVAATTGCREAARPATPVPDLIVADSRDGLVVLDGTRRQSLGTAAAVSPDGARAYTVRAGTALVRLDAAGVAPTRSITLGGGWVPRAVSPDGRGCALGQGPAAARPAGRERTALLVVVDGRQRPYDLGGVVEPDAFTRDCTGLFVLEWLPPQAPDRYRVRLLDLASGRLGPLFTRDKTAVPPGAEEEMRGAGRQAVLSPDGEVLYTLYTHQPGHRHTRDLIAGRPGGAHAFVHVLHLAQRWAYCLDLPHPFGEGPAAGHAIAADGRRLAVVDVTSGSLMYADPVTLAIQRVAPVPPGKGTASLALGRASFAGAGTTVTVHDDTGAPTARWSTPGPVRGLGVSRDGTRLYAGGADEVVWLDTASGAVRGRAPVGGLTTLLHVRPQEQA